MDFFGDYDPDDAVDVGDPVDVQLELMARRVAWAIEHRDDLPDRLRRIIDDIHRLADRVANGF
jgi:hypothetical protein